MNLLEKATKGPVALKDVLGEHVSQAIARCHLVSSILKSVGRNPEAGLVDLVRDDLAQARGVIEKHWGK